MATRSRPTAGVTPADRARLRALLIVAVVFLAVLVVITAAGTITMALPGYVPFQRTVELSI